MPPLTLTVIAGPDVAPPVPLPRGRHVVGRAATADVRIADPLVERHHVLLDVTDDGTVTVWPLAGHVPPVVGGAPVAGGRTLRPDEPLDLGATRIVVAPGRPSPPPATTGEVPGDRWRRILVRVPRSVSATDGPPLGVPATPPPVASAGAPGALVGVATGAIGAVVMAGVLGQPTFALFGLLAASGSLATWLATWRRDHRARRRARAEVQGAIAGFLTELDAEAARRRAAHLEAAPTATRALATLGSAHTWARRPGHGDAFEVSLGWGDVRRPLPLAVPDGAGVPAELQAAVAHAEVLTDVPVTIALDAEPRSVVAVAGDGADAVVRSLVLQLAASTGPADWRLLVVSDRPAHHAWTAPLPHTTAPVVPAGDPAAVAAALASLRSGGARPLILTDHVAALTARAGPLRRFLDDAPAATVLLELPAGAPVPACCDAVLGIGARGRARWHQNGDVAPDPSTGSAWDQRLLVAGISLERAAAAARTLARFVDPERHDATTAIAPAVSLAALDGISLDPDDIAAGWRAGGDDPPPAVPIGHDVDGPVVLDLSRDGPHVLVAGTTGSGKSELLRTLVVGLAIRVAPEHLAFALVDYKGGATFDGCAALPHVVGVVTDLDDGLAARALRGVEAELRRRERLLRDTGAADLTAYRRLAPDRPLARLVVVVDEFAALAADVPEFLAALVSLAQRGRSLGVHLVLATQRPAGVVDDAIRANSALRIALRLHDVADAVDVVGDPIPASFPADAPGRAAVRRGRPELEVLQVASCAPLERYADAVRRAAAIHDRPRPPAVWLPPLPATLPWSDRQAGSVGVVDDPAGPRTSPLRWDHRSHLAIIGARRSGTTTALRAIATGLTEQAGPDDHHLYVLDARGDEALGRLDGIAHCGGVVRIHERERVDRLLGVLADEVDRRSAGAVAPSRPVTLLVDGLAAVRVALDDPRRLADLARFERLLADGPAVGIAAAATIDPAAGPVAGWLARFAERWVLHLTDPGDGPVLGVPRQRVAPAVPGRLVVVTSGLDAQLAEPPLVERAERACGGPSPIAVLPDVVEAATVAGRSTSGHGITSLCLGLAHRTLAPASLRLADGDHVLVVGPARSGRSAALAGLARAWVEAHPAGSVSVVCPLPGSPLARWPGAVARAGDWRPPDGPCLLVVDDADRLDDGAALVPLALGTAATIAPVTIAAAVSADGRRPSFDHWTTALRRGSTALIVAVAADAGAEAAAELVGVTLPRRPPIDPRPGLCWLVGQGQPELVQLAFAGPGDEPVRSGVRSRARLAR